jgi:hypothetical protein
MMTILREAYGADRILGSQFPQEKPKPDESALTEVQKYLRSKRMEKQSKRPAKKDYKQMNPDGFWECKYTVRGIQWTLADHDQLNDSKNKIVKIVSQGLVSTDPLYVRRVIYMIRNPRCVATSQEELRGQFGELDNPEIVGAGEVKKHSPSMFNRVSKMAAAWFVKFPAVPFLIVNYDSLLDNPASEIKRVIDFLGGGNLTRAVAVVKQNLRRSAPSVHVGAEWDCADTLYQFINAGLWTCVKAVELPVAQKESACFCTRLNRRVVEAECKLCQSHETTRKNYIKSAFKQRIRWDAEPCLYECKENGKTIQESIDGNHWQKTSFDLTEFPLMQLERARRAVCNVCEFQTSCILYTKFKDCGTRIKNPNWHCPKKRWPNPKDYVKQ